MAIFTGKCPKCGRTPVGGITMQGVNIKGPDGRGWMGVAYLCSYFDCQAILGTGIDPIAIKTDTVKEVVKQLRGRI